jgi:hypothetical protein
MGMNKPFSIFAMMIIKIVRDVLLYIIFRVGRLVMADVIQIQKRCQRAPADYVVSFYGIMVGVLSVEMPVWVKELA